MNKAKQAPVLIFFPLNYLSSSGAMKRIVSRPRFQPVKSKKSNHLGSYFIFFLPERENADLERAERSLASLLPAPFVYVDPKFVSPSEAEPLRCSSEMLS